MNINLQGRVIAITGGSEGIGEGIARGCAACGAKVAIFARGEDDLKRVVESIGESGGEAMYHCVDVTESDEVKAGIDAVADRFGRIDGLVANAGTNGTWTPIDEMSPEEWRTTIDVNLAGTYLTLHHGVPHLKRAGRGSIVIVSSINGTRTFSNEGASAYATTKAGQLALGKMLALELAGFKIRVNVICPGGIESQIHDKTERDDLEKIETPVDYPEGQIPLTGGAMGKPEQVASLAAFLLSDLSDHITGTPIWIDGGQSLIA